MIKHDGFRTLLYYKFTYTKAYRVDEVADKMGIPAITFYKYISGQMSFPVDLVAKLYNATGDMEFLNFILNDTPLMLTPRETATAGKDLTSETLDAMAAAGQLATEVQSVMTDGAVSEIEKKRLNNQIDRAHKELEDVRKVVNTKK